jgi:exosortase A-associated hydrolase 2
MGAVSADAFLLPVGTGFRYCLLRLPARKTTLRGCLLLVPPFAEELNKSRRMIALAAERMAADNYAVLVMDYFGCGDSSGDFGDASWGEWLSDFERGYDWLASRYNNLPIWIWGVRAGALLATAGLKRIDRPANLIFWQPVVSGQLHLTQFVRLKFANAFLGQGSIRSNTQTLVKRLMAGETLEIAGYTLTPAIATGLAGSELGVPSGFTGNIVCLEVATAGNEDISPALRACAQSWREAGAAVRTQTTPGVPFWQTQQITEAPNLIEAMLTCLVEGAP